MYLTIESDGAIVYQSSGTLVMFSSRSKADRLSAFLLLLGSSTCSTAG